MHSPHKVFPGRHPGRFRFDRLLGHLPLQEGQGNTFSIYKSLTGGDELTTIVHDPDVIIGGLYRKAELLRFGDESTAR